MKRIIVVGPITHHHICNFVGKLKAIKPEYELFGVDNMGSLRAETPFDHVIFPKRYNSNGLISRILAFINLILAFNRIYRSGKIDIVQFQYVNKSTYPLCVLAKLHKSRVNCFVWGSDFLRASDRLKRSLSRAFMLADTVVADSDYLVDSLKKYYISQSDKIFKASFGSIIVDKIYESKVDKNEHLTALNIPLSYDCVIMCGYNASPAQNHDDIINAIKNNPGNNLWIFPMTYGNQGNYLSRIKKELSSINGSIIVLDSFIDDDMWVHYIMATDIFIHIQNSDSFSSTLAEHLIAGNVIINGEWLEYKEFKDNKIFYRTTSKEGLSGVLKDTILNINELRQKCKANVLPMYNEKSLRRTIESNWIPLFE